MAIFTPEPCPSAGNMPPVSCGLDGPVITPYRYGAITAWDVIDATDPHQRYGILYESLACTADVLPMPDGICPPDPFVKVPTYGDESTYVRGCPFSLYAALDCRRTTLANMQRDVEEVFRLGEQRALEAAVWTNLIAQPDAVVINTIPAEPGALGIGPGIAALESAMAGCYPGQATIHLDRGLGIYLASEHLLEKQGSGLFTPLGSKIALYGNTPNTGPDGLPAPDGHAWIYATGQLTLRRFAQDTKTPDFPLTRDANGGQTNVPYAMSERTYVADVPCCKRAVLVCLGVC